MKKNEYGTARRTVREAVAHSNSFFSILICGIFLWSLCLIAVPAFAAREVDGQHDGQMSAENGSAASEKFSPAGKAARKPSSGKNRPVEVRELWTGGLYSSTYKVGICVSAQGKVRGVVHLRLYNGKVDVYHIEGEVENNEVVARHSSGHSFKGRLVSSDAVEGDISLKNGMKIHLTGKRIHDVALAPEDCAPLPQ